LKKKIAERDGGTGREHQIFVIGIAEGDIGATQRNRAADPIGANGYVASRTA